MHHTQTLKCKERVKQFCGQTQTRTGRNGATQTTEKFSLNELRKKKFRLLQKRASNLRMSTSSIPSVS